MKTLILSLSLALSLPLFAHAAPEVLLDCNLGGGDTQQFTVIRDGARLKLKELTMQGSFVERELSQSEWRSGTLRIWTRDRFSKGTVKKDRDGALFFEFVAPGYKYTGYADCS